MDLLCKVFGTHFFLEHDGSEAYGRMHVGIPMCCCVGLGAVGVLACLLALQVMDTGLVLSAFKTLRPPGQVWLSG